MTRRDLAGWLCHTVHATRLKRVNEPMPEQHGNPLDDLPESEQQNWLDMADAALQFVQEFRPEQRMRELTSDWTRYTLQLGHDQEWRDQMRRAVVVEMKAEVDKLAAECEL